MLFIAVSSRKAKLHGFSPASHPTYIPLSVVYEGLKLVYTSKTWNLSATCVRLMIRTYLAQSTAAAKDIPARLPLPVWIFYWKKNDPVLLLFTAAATMVVPLHIKFIIFCAASPPQPRALCGAMREAGCCFRCCSGVLGVHASTPWW